MGNRYIGLFGLKQQNDLKAILNKALEGQMSNTIKYIVFNRPCVPYRLID